MKESLKRCRAADERPGISQSQTQSRSRLTRAPRASQRDPPARPERSRRNAKRANENAPGRSRPTKGGTNDAQGRTQGRPDDAPGRAVPTARANEDPDRGRRTRGAEAGAPGGPGRTPDDAARGQGRNESLGLGADTEVGPGRNAPGARAEGPGLDEGPDRTLPEVRNEAGAEINGDPAPSRQDRVIVTVRSHRIGTGTKIRFCSCSRLYNFYA